MPSFTIDYDPISRKFSVTVAGRVIGYVESYLDGEAVARAYHDGLQAGQASTQRQDTRKALSLTEAAQQLGVSRTSLYKLIGRGEVQSFKVGARNLVPVASIEAYIERQQTAPEPIDLSILETRPYARRVG